ncbi:MAG: hypothetical protein H6574_08785 [Lewinellaceae bacterium]|nr:hypothetical protein [Lewinellaceae bacterium]
MDDEVSSLWASDLSIESFIPITRLDKKHYERNVFGITYSEEKKDEILDNLNRITQVPDGAKFIWSDKMELNRHTEESAFRLYLVKTNFGEPAISSIEMDSAKMIQGYQGDIQVLVTLSSSGAEKLSTITTRAANSYRHIAFEINGEVIFCPKVMNPLDEGLISIAGFNSESNAQMVIEFIKKNSR